MKWFRKYFRMRSIPGARCVEPSTEKSELSGIKDIDSYVDEYLANFYVDVDYSGDQRDHHLLEKIRSSAGDQENEVILSVLLNGLEKTSKFGIFSFEGKSFLKAIGELGDPKAISPLRLLFESHADLKKPDARNTIAFTLFLLGDLNWISDRIELQELVKLLVVSKINSDGSIRFTHYLSGASILEAGELLQRNGDFLAQLESSIGHDKFTDQKVVERALGTT